MDFLKEFCHWLQNRDFALNIGGSTWAVPLLLCANASSYLTNAAVDIKFPSSALESVTDSCKESS
jgi:hypothetical protein